MKKERDFSNNPYGKAGDVVTKQIIDRVLRSFSSPNAERGEKTIGEMEDEIMKRVQEKVQIIN